jgi:hypothetical protein
MRTTLDLPEDLIDEAMKATNIKTKTKVIIAALEQLIRKTKIAAIDGVRSQHLTYQSSICQVLRPDPVYRRKQWLDR